MPGPSWSTCSPAPPRASAHHTVAVGHAHIDCAWLWPVRETVRKCARTFSNVVQLVDADPGFPVRLLVGPAVRLDEGLLPRAVRPDHREGPARGSSSRSAGCGSSPTPTCPAARRWPDSSLPGNASSSTTSASRPTSSGCPTRSATPRRCRRSSARPARAGSSPRRSPGTRSTRCRTTRSGGRGSTAVGCSPTSRRRTPTTRRCRAQSWPAAIGSTGRRAGETPR